MIQFVWPVPLIICYLFAPESPYYCVRKGKLEEAKKVLRRIRNMKNTTEEEIEQEVALIDYTNKVEGALSKSGTYIECFTGKDLWRTEIVSPSTTVGQEARNVLSSCVPCANVKLVGLHGRHVHQLGWERH